MIEAKRISKSYGRVKALDSIDLKVESGEIFGILGSNGAGKSTLLKILACIVPPTSGEGWLCGKSILKATTDVKGLISYLPEVPSFPDKLTGRELLEMVASLRRLDDSVAHAWEGLAKKLDLPELDAPTETYSKGMRQKLSIILAFFHEPKMLLLDEPTSGLDPKYSRVIRQMIAQSGVTVLVSTHSAFLAQETCSRVAILHRGRIIVSGPTRSLIESASATDLEETFITLVGRCGDERA